MPKKSIDQYIEEANARLKGSESALKISRVGKRLYVRGTLPPKPDSLKSKPHQQTITLQENRASVACLKLIEAECSNSQFGEKLFKPQQCRYGNAI